MSPPIEAHPVSFHEDIPQARLHPRTVGWFGTTAVAMGGINQSLFLIGALFIGQDSIPGQGSAAVVLLAVGLILSWMATPGWTELILMYPNRVGGIAATCAEAFRPYSPVLANLTGVCYWWGWVPTCGLTALLSASAINQWYLPWFPVPLLASLIVLTFTFINLCGVKWVMRFSMPIATVSALLAFLSAVIPIFSGLVNWEQAFTFHLTVPFEGIFGQITSVMAGLYLVGFAAPAFEQASCHVGETIDPNKNVPRAMFASAGLATLYFIVLPLVWLGTLGPEPLGKELALELGPTFAPLFGGAAKAAAIWFMILNMFHGTMAPLAGAARTLAQLAEDGLLPEFMGIRSSKDVPWVTTLITAFMAIAFLLCGDPVWLIAAANLTYLIGIALPNVAVWLLRKNQPTMTRPYRAPRGTIVLGLIAAATWFLTAILGFQQFGLPTVLIGIAFAYSGSILYAWRKFVDRRKQGLNGIAHSLHIKLTGAMLLVLVLDGFGYLIAIEHVTKTIENAPLITALEDIFVVVALLTISVGLILPGMIAHSAVEVSVAADKLVKGTLADFTRAMRALAAGDLGGAIARINLTPVLVNSKDEVGEMAANFNKLQEEIGRSAFGLQGAREGLSEARNELTEINGRLRVELAERRHAEESLRQLRDQHAMILNSINEGVHGIDSEGKIVFENPAALKMLGYEITELIGKPALETIHHTRSNGAPNSISDSPIYATLLDGRIRHTDGDVFWRKDGTSFPVDFTTTPVRDEKGKIIGTTVVFTDITERKQAELEIERVNRQLLETSRKAGMAEVATSVLHNVGNVLNSVNVSCTVISDTVRKSRVSNVTKTAALFKDHAGDLASFFNDDATGKQLPEFLRLLGERLNEEQNAILAELQSLSNNIEHIKAIVAVQQGYASATGTMETLPIQDLAEIALRMNSERLTRHQVVIVRDYSDVPPLDLEKHSVLQILVNLVRNAKHAVLESDHSEKQITVRIFKPDIHSVAISIRDNGVGIPPENLSHIFTRGFTTKAEGHGFGLHASFQAAQDMGSNLQVHSDGLGKGCTFTLELPLGKTRHN